MNNTYYDRSVEAKVLGMMMVLFQRFTVISVVNYPDGKIDLVTYWINADAEQHYNEFKQRYEELQQLKEKEGE